MKDRSNLILIIPIIITIALVMLRLADVINWSWWIVFLPMILLTVFVTAIIIIVIKVAYLFDWY